MNFKKTALSNIVLIIVFILSSIPLAAAAEPLWTYSSPGNEIGGVSVSSDGSAIAVAAGKILLFSNKGSLLAKEPFGDQVVFTPDGSSLVSSYSTTLFQFKRKTSSTGSESSLQKVWEAQLPATVRSIDISDDGKIIVASVNAAGTYIYTSTGKMAGGDKRFNALVRVSSTGSRIVGVSAGVLCLYTRTGTCLKAEEELVGVEPDFMELSNSGNISVFNDDQRIRSVYLNNETIRWTKRATGDVTSLTMTPSGSSILAGTENGNADLFNESGYLSWSYASNPTNKQSAGITCVALSKEGNVAVAGSKDGKIFALNSTGGVIWSNQTKDSIHHIAISGDGALVVATGDETVYAFSTTLRQVSGGRTTVISSIPTPSQSFTILPGNYATQKPESHDSTPRTTTAEPTEYSVIRTPTQSPQSIIFPFVAFLIVLVMVMGRR